MISILKKIPLKTRIKLILALCLIFFCLFILFLSKGIILRSANNFIDNLEESTGIRLGKEIYDIESSINIFRDKRDLWSGDLPIFQMKLSPNDIAHFDNLSKQSILRGYLDKDENVWRKIQLKYNGKIFDAKIKIHGDSQDHWKFELKSFNVKLMDNDTINGLKKFAFIMIEERQIEGRLIKVLSKDFGQFDIIDDFVVLKINGVPQGLYYLLEKLDKDFLERNQCSSCTIVRVQDSKFEDHPIFLPSGDYNTYGLDYYPMTHATPLDFEISHSVLENSDIDLRKVNYELYNLYEAVKSDDSETVLNYFDIDQVASFEAIRMIMGTRHVNGDNLRMIYSGTKSKFFFIPWEVTMELLRINKGGFENYLNMYDNTIDNEIKEKKLFTILNRNDQIRQLKYQKVYNYIQDETIFISKVEEIIQEFLPFINSHRGSIFGTAPLEKLILGFKDIFSYNIKKIKEVLNYATIYINLIQENNKVIIEIVPDSVSQLKFDYIALNLFPGEFYTGEITLQYVKPDKTIFRKSIRINSSDNPLIITELIKDIPFMTGLDENMGTDRRIYHIELNFLNANLINIASVDLRVRNDITDKYLSDKKVYLEIADANDEVYIPKQANELIDIYPTLRWDFHPGEIRLLKGDYILFNDLIIPENYLFKIEKGTIISVDKDKSIVSYSPVKIEGTSDEPVIIKALDPQSPFGTFGIVGRNASPKTIINGLHLSGGSEKFINGIYFSGALSIHHMDVELTNSLIESNHADDGLNIKYGNILIDNSVFKNNFADQVDLDFVEGIIKNSKFIEESSGDDNGDGLDFSGSFIIINNNTFIGFQDKGISIGEKTKVVLYGNQVINNNIGVAVKDSSHAYFLSNLFKDNQVAISAYQKKIIYSTGGYYYLFDNTFESNLDLFESDALSKGFKLKLNDKKYGTFKKIIADENIESLRNILENDANNNSSKE